MSKDVPSITCEKCKAILVITYDEGCKVYHHQCQCRSLFLPLPVKSAVAWESALRWVEEGPETGRPRNLQAPNNSPEEERGSSNPHPPGPANNPPRRPPVMSKENMNKDNISQSRIAASNDDSPNTSPEEAREAFGNLEAEGVTAQPNVIPNPDPFNAEEFVIDQDFFKSAPVKKLLTTVRVKKPNPQDFIRVHPAAEYRKNLVLLELKEERETYLMIPALYQQLEESERTGSYTATLYLCVNRQKVPFIWPVRLPGRDGRILEWHTSARAAAETAMLSWVRIVANRDAGAYDVFKAELAFSEPVWPEHSFAELLKIAFKERVIREADHPVLQRLRGAL